MKNLLILCLLLSATKCFAQKNETHRWLIDSTLYLSDSTAVSSLWFNDKKTGIAFFNENGIVSNELSLSGRILGLSKWKGKVVVFYVPDQSDEWKVVHDIHAVLIDVNTKTVLKDQPFVTNPGKTFIVGQVKNDDQGNFGCLLIRATALEGDYDGNNSKRVGHRNETVSLTAMYLSDDFQPVAQTLSSGAINTAFFAAYANRKGELAVLSWSNGQVLAEKFGRDGKLQKKATVSFQGFNAWEIDGHNWARGAFRGDDDVLAFSVTKGVFVVDFGAEKAWPLETPWLNDKVYNAHLEENLNAEKLRNFKYLGSFKPDCLFFKGDTLIFSKEIQYWEQPLQNFRYIGGGTQVQIYDRQFHYLHMFLADRYFESFSDGGYRWTYHVQNGKLLAFGNALTHIEHYENICVVMDLHTFTMEQKTMDWGDINHHDYSEPSRVFWFRDNLLKDPSTAGGFARHPESQLIKMAYP